MKNTTMKPTGIKRKRNRIEKGNRSEQKSVASSDNAALPEKTKNEFDKLKKQVIDPGKVFGMAVAVFAAGFITSCSSPSEKVENAKENVELANEDLNEAQDEYAHDVAQFKLASEKKIEENEKAIADFNAKIQKSKNKVDTEYKTQIESLKQNNKELKSKMENYEPDTKEEWLFFKAEFNKDMEKLGAALKDFTVDSK